MKKNFAIFVSFILLFFSFGEAHSAPLWIRSVGHRQVMLTFDDGPFTTLTGELLDVLREKKVKATFFLLGRDVKKFPDTVKKIADAGHVIGNHSYSHRKLKGMEYDEILEELKSCNDVLEEITGQRPRFMRPPHGAFDANVLRACKAENLTIVYWKNNPGDYEGDSAEVLRDNIITARANGDIILLHLGLQNTIDALPDVIDFYRKSGFTFITAEQVKK